MAEIVSVTKKGQATIPKRLRKKYGIKNKILVEENENGIVIKPLPSPKEDYGSLRLVFKGKTARELLENARREEARQDREWTKRVGSSDI